MRMRKLRERVKGPLSRWMRSCKGSRWLWEKGQAPQMSKVGGWKWDGTGTRSVGCCRVGEGCILTARLYFNENIDGKSEVV